jgi:hypothetical protein
VFSDVQAAGLVAAVFLYELYLVAWRYIMKTQNTIDFKEMDWSGVDQEKAGFFYNEATGYNDGLIESINNLNAKAFSLIAVALPVMSAAAGFLLGIWDKADKRPVALILLFAFFGLAAAIILLLLAVLPRGIHLSKGTPLSYFTDDFYKADMRHLFSFGIATLNTYIRHNQKIMEYRGRLLFAGTLVLIATPIVTVAVFLIRLLNW